MMGDNHDHVNRTIETELSRQLFHLKTLYDVSRELLGLVDMDAILRNFLLMSLGNFGVVEGFVFLNERNAENADRLVCIGIQETDYAALDKGCRKLLTQYPDSVGIEYVSQNKRLSLFPAFISCLSLFQVAYSCGGIVGLGQKIVGEPYDDEDKHLLDTLINNLIIVLKNARSTAALKSAYEEVSALNRAKDKLINHLSHELRTPVSLLKTALRLLKKPLSSLPEELWERSFMRAERSLARLSEIESGAEDIILKKEYRQYPMVSKLLEQCADVLEAVTAEQTGQRDIVEKVRQRIDAIYQSGENALEKIHLEPFIRGKMDALRSVFESRDLNVVFHGNADPVVYIPEAILNTVVTALIKNAVENTPDQGRIDVLLRLNRREAELTVHDFGVGIAKEHRRRIFEGFYPTQDVHSYATKTPFKFNAGGKGSDLLRLKIFSERYHFKINLMSARCRNLPHAGDSCPGKISRCSHCSRPEDCHASGFSIFQVSFPVDA
jgi:signal transduction histidine kinase